MRKLITNSNDKQRQLIDGVRIFEDEGWVLVTPDRLTAAFNISAEAESSEGVTSLIERYSTIVEESQNV